MNFLNTFYRFLGEIVRIFIIGSEAKVYFFFARTTTNIIFDIFFILIGHATSTRHPRCTVQENPPARGRAHQQQ